MFSGLALKSCVVWITKKRDIRDSIINLILQSFQNETLKGTRFSAAKEVSGIYIHRDGLHNNTFEEESRTSFVLYVWYPMVRILKAMLKFETWFRTHKYTVAWICLIKFNNYILKEAKKLLKRFVF